METEQNRDIILTDCHAVLAMTAKAKSKYHLFGGFYCAELEAVCNGVKRNEILLKMWDCYPIKKDEYFHLGFGYIDNRLISLIYFKAC